ncbi:MAG: acetylglutamate kinase [Myxococcaceae bacterium]
MRQNSGTEAHTLSSFAGQWFVVKIGGELASDAGRLAASVGAAVSAFLEAGIQVLIVHGAGPQATALSQRLGIAPNMVGGRRVTDAATLEVMKMTLAGQVSVDIAATLSRAGIPALATTGVSAGLVRARKRPPLVVRGGGPAPVDFGLVGDVEFVDVQRLQRLVHAGFVPVLGSLAADVNGQVLNINADTVAGQIAGALKAAKLFLVSNVPGVLANKDDPTTRIPRLTPNDAKARMDSGVIVGGMIPKVEEGLALLQGGVGAVHIVGIDPPTALFDEACAPGSQGTVFLRG